MSEQAVEESIPLLAELHGNKVKKELFILRVRIVYTLVPMFALSTLSVRDSMLAQYLVTRLGNDAGYLNHTKFTSCSKDVNDSSQAEINSIQSQASELQTYYGYAQCVPAFFICFFIGSYSDYLGRRFLLLLPVFTTFIKMIIITFIIRFHLDLHFMYLAYGLDGFSGSWYSMLLGLYAITADISTTKTERTFWIFIVSCSAAIMESIANIASGYLINLNGFFEASMFLSCMLAVAFIFPFFLLPETYLHRPVKKEYNPLVHIRRIFGFYFFDGSVRKRVTYCMGLLLFIIGIANILWISSIDALYQMHDPFCWSSKQIGYYASIRGAGAYVIGAVYLKVMQRCIAIEKIAILGLLFQGSAFIMEAFISKSWQFYLVPILGSPGTPLTSIIRTILSVMTGPEMQGALFSSVAVVETAVGLVAVVAWNKIYAATVSFMPGFVYIVMAGCSFTTCALFLIYLRVHDKPQPIEHSNVVEEHPDLQ